MSTAGKRGVLIAGVVVMVAIVVAGVLTFTNTGKSASPTLAAQQSSAAPPSPPAPTAPDPKSAAEQYLQAFGIGDAETASMATDDPSSASAVLTDVWQNLHPTEIKTKLGKISTASGDTATVSYTLTWMLPHDHEWTYDDTFDVVRNGNNWRVDWTPAAVHPSLRAGQRLMIVDTVPERTAVVDRDGKPLVTTGASGPELLRSAPFPLLRSALIKPVQPTSAVFAVDRVDASGLALQTLFGHTASTAKPLKSTLSSTIETAAQSVVDGYSGKAAIVALRPSDGGLLAVAENAQTENASPFSGLYAPGSTFKIATATAAIENGVANVDSALPCPLSVTLGVRTIRNEGFDLGTTTMHRAFARSCNTTFAQLASHLHANGLVAAADQYGLNADFDIPGLPTQTGKVVAAANATELVEDGIGQGTVQVSPFGEALMAATVEAGHAVTPRLWQDIDTKVLTGYEGPSSSVLASLRTMMREVVTGGTATGLDHSGLVYGKTGTAQFGTGDDANGWFVGYRGDLAFAVFLEDADDSKPAVTLAAKFLAALD